MSKKLIIIFLLNILFSIFLSNLRGQNISNKEIDFNLEKAQENFIIFNFAESLNFAVTARKESEKNKYDAGIVKSNIYLARILFEVGAFTEALECLDKANAPKFFKKNVIMQVEAHRIRGRTYGMLKLYDQAIAEFKKQLTLSDKIEDAEKQKRSKFFAHQNLSHVYRTINDKASTWVHLNHQLNLLKSSPEELRFYELSTTYVQMAAEYIEVNEFEKAQNLLDQSVSLLQKYDASYIFNTLEQYGNLEVRRGNLELAEAYYRRGLQNAIDLKDKDAEMDFYDVLGDFYVDHRLDQKKSNTFLIKHKKIKDSLDKNNKLALNMGLKQIAESKEKGMTQKVFNLRLVILIITASLLLVVLLFFFGYKKHKVVVESNYSLIESTEILQEKLENTVADNKFIDLIELAKANDSQFLILFTELYPNFILQLKNKDAHIRTPELMFCAMTYLNFSTKDIADYTFVTTRAVQIRKNRMRKKYDIPSDVDFNSWMRKLDSPNTL